ncbi:hypothetical protein ACFHW2_12110 [Actinomadura sp. LOL_016]|uniref:hypothetical protein n=1 Tax=unclassified Actinomadura TaxID=2626254 RepID=UPI003A801316
MSSGDRGRYGNPCLICGATPTRLFISGYRCRTCTPAAENGRPEPPRGRCAPARCHCGKPNCHAYETYGRDIEENPLAWAAIDARAVASGKRRANPQEQAAAKAAVADQKDRDAAHRRAGGRNEPGGEGR